jgi:5-epi-alpha-selinene synthase
MGGVEHEELRYPITPCENEFADAIDRDVVRWALDSELLDSAEEIVAFARIRCGAIAARTWPYANRNVTELGARLVGYLFLFDDRFVEPLRDEEALTASLKTFEDAIGSLKSPRESPYHAALIDIVESLMSELNPSDASAWQGRFLESLKSYFAGCVQECRLRKTGEVPNLEKYIGLRTQSIGVLPCFDLIEVALKQVHDPGVFDALVELRKMAAQICAWVNDLYSFKREDALGDPNNVVRVVMNNEGKTDAEARSSVIRMHNRQVEQLCEAARDIPPAAVGYVEGLKHWVRGNYDWTTFSGRYDDDRA